MKLFEQQLYYWTHMLDEAYGIKNSVNEAWMTDGNTTKWFSDDDVYDAKKDGFRFTSRPSQQSATSQRATSLIGPHRMQPREYYAFIDDLKRGQVVFKYQKKDGTIRTAKGTLNPNVAEGQGQSRYGYISYWDLDAHDWRMFNANNFISKDSVEELQTSSSIGNYDELFQQTESIKPTSPHPLQSDSNIKWLIENNSFTEINNHDGDIGIDFNWKCPIVRGSKSYPNAEFNMLVYWSTKYKHWYVTGYEAFEGNDHKVWGNFGGVHLGCNYVAQLSKSYPLLKAFLSQYIEDNQKLSNNEKNIITQQLQSIKTFDEAYDGTYD